MNDERTANEIVGDAIGKLQEQAEIEQLEKEQQEFIDLLKVQCIHKSKTQILSAAFQIVIDTYNSLDSSRDKFYLYMDCLGA